MFPFSRSKKYSPSFFKERGDRSNFKSMSTTITEQQIHAWNQTNWTKKRPGVGAGICHALSIQWLLFRESLREEKYQGKEPAAIRALNMLLRYKRNEDESIDSLARLQQQIHQHRGIKLSSRNLKQSLNSYLPNCIWSIEPENKTILSDFPKLAIIGNDKTWQRTAGHGIAVTQAETPGNAEIFDPNHGIYVVRKHQVDQKLKQLTEAILYGENRGALSKYELFLTKKVIHQTARPLFNQALSSWNALPIPQNHPASQNRITTKSCH